ncbi:MAG: CBS domain-containing protein [Candidatus Methanomethylicia archaeon]
MTRRVIYTYPESSILDVRNLMIRHRISRVVIVENKKPIGIVTQRDLLRFIAENPSVDVSEAKVTEAMSGRLITAKPTDTVSYAAKLMISNGISSIVIVCDEELNGIITKFDLCICCMERFKGFFKVREYMTPNPVTVRPTLNIFEIVNIMNSKGIGRVIVVENGKPIGIITLSDLISVIPDILSIKVDYKREFRRIRTLGIWLLVASDIMTPNPITIHEDEDMAEASHLMVKHNISGLPVASRELLIGIITKTDITRAIANITI